MKTTRKILLSLFLLAMLITLSDLGNMKAEAASKGKYFLSGDLYYHTISKNKVEVCGTTKEEGTLTIPGYVNYKGKMYTVTQIADHEIYYQDDIDETNGYYIDVDMPGWIYYQYDRVDGKSIPNNVEWLSDSGIQKVILPDTLTYIGEGAFGSCEKLKTVVFAKKYKKLVIGKNAFCGMKMKKIAFPEGTYELKQAAAGATPEIYIPSTVKKIAGGVVNYKTKKVTISKKNKKFKMKNGMLYTKNEKQLLGASAKVKKTVKISSKTTSIAEMAFAGTKITSVTLNDKIKTIPKGAFYKCSKLKTVSGVNHVINIEDAAFANCEKLQSLGNLSALTTIGRAAFWKDSQLVLTLPETTNNVDDYAFSGKEETTKMQISVAENNAALYVKDGFLVKKDGDKQILLLQMNDTGINGYVTVPEGITHIPVVIKGGKNLEVVLPKTLVSHDAFVLAPGGSVVYQSDKVPEFGNKFRIGEFLTYYEPGADIHVTLKVPATAIDSYKAAIETAYALQDDTGDECYVLRDGVNVLRIWNTDSGLITLKQID